MQAKGALCVGCRSQSPCLLCCLLLHALWAGYEIHFSLSVYEGRKCYVVIICMAVICLCLHAGGTLEGDGRAATGTTKDIQAATGEGRWFLNHLMRDAATYT